MKLGVRQDFDSDLNSFQHPPPMAGPSLNMDLGGRRFGLTKMQISGAAWKPGTLVLTLEQKAPSANPKAADALNHDLIGGFVRTDPGWTETFGLVRAVALYPDGKSGFATVFDAKRGYSRAKDAG